MATVMVRANFKVRVGASLVLVLVLGLVLGLWLDLGLGLLLGFRFKSRVSG